MSNILLVGAIVMVLGVLIGVVFGSKGLHENGADLLSYLLFGAGLGCVIIWFIVMLASALAP